ncbi:MAG: SDR family oxidoreductase [Bacteroidota bacterium]
MDLGLQGRVAFVAGASGGLGYATAQQLAEEGARVAIASRNPARIDAAAQSIREAVPGAVVLPIVCDVTDEAAIAQALATAADTFGGLNILITNAGGPPSGPLNSFAAEAWRKALDLNLMSTINLCRHALPYLEAAAEAGLARILMITSISAKQPIAGLALSNTARAGVQGYAKSLAEELGPQGITVNTVLPGYTKTDRLGELAERIRAQTGQSLEAIEAGWAEANALKRLASPDEFAAAVVFLASARASYITGTAMVVDGGRSKHLL